MMTTRTATSMHGGGWWTAHSLGALVGIALVAAGCTPAHLPLASYGLPDGDSMVTVGPVRAALRAGDTWLQVRLMNTGDAPMTVSWDEASFVSPDGARHRLVDGSELAAVLRAWQGDRQERAEWTPARSRGGDLGAGRNRLGHDAPDWLGPGSTWSVAPDEDREWILYPAEHLAMDDVGNLSITPLLLNHGTAAAHGTAATPRLSVTVPVRVDGRRWPVVLEARVLPPDPGPCCGSTVRALVPRP